MFRNIKDYSGIDLVLFDENTKNAKSLHAIVINKISNDEIVIIPIDNKYEPRTVFSNEVLGCSRCDIKDTIYKKVKIMAEKAKEIKKLELLLEQEHLEYEKMIHQLRSTVFIDKYTARGACSYINNLIKGKTLNINENIISLFFFTEEDNSVDVSIKISKKFEYFNTTSENDIEKAADTYAPVIRDEIVNTFPMFKDIFIVNKSFNKLGDYLYESCCEYNASMDCNKEIFFDRLKEILKIFDIEVPIS